MRFVRVSVLACAAMVCLVSASPASAEWQTDLFFGGSFTPKTWLDVDSTLPLLGNQRLRAADRIELRDSVNIGGRVGYWFESLKWLGVGLDVMHFRADVDNQGAPRLERARILSELREIDVKLIAVTLDLMLRLPRIWDDRLEPYFTLGPTAFVTRLEDSSNLQPPNQSATGVFPGFKIGAGIGHRITKNVSLFSEYRLTRTTVDLDDQDFQRNSFGGVPAEADAHMNVITHHLVFGVSVRY